MAAFSGTLLASSRNASNSFFSRDESTESDGISPLIFPTISCTCLLLDWTEWSKFYNTKDRLVLRIGTMIGAFVEV